MLLNFCSFNIIVSILKCLKLILREIENDKFIFYKIMVEERKIKGVGYWKRREK